MEASKQIFVVVTPELASAHMAREKIRYLKRLNLADRAAIVVNRAQKKSLVSREQIEDVLKVPVVASFTNDYHRVNAALTAGKPIDANSELGKQLESFAASLLERKHTVGDAKGKLTDYFSLSSAKSLFRVAEVMRVEGELK
jgi:Flp pilus assembly CpaE family ATPase